LEVTSDDLSKGRLSNADLLEEKWRVHAENLTSPRQIASDDL
jgi:hypothetical protein